MMNHDANRVYAVSEYDDGRQGLGAFILNKKEGTMTPLGILFSCRVAFVPHF